MPWKDIFKCHFWWKKFAIAKNFALELVLWIHHQVGFAWHLNLKPIKKHTIVRSRHKTFMNCTIFNQLGTYTNSAEAKKQLKIKVVKWGYGLWCYEISCDSNPPVLNSFKIIINLIIFPMTIGVIHLDISIRNLLIDDECWNNTKLPIVRHSSFEQKISV